MTGLSIPPGSLGPWSGGVVTPVATCLLAPNASPMTLDGTNTWVLAAEGGRDALVVDPGPADDGHLGAVAQLLNESGLKPLGIVLTHGHSDHSEGARALADALGCWVRAIDPQHQWGGEGLAPDSVVAGDGFECQMVLTPGHTSDSVSLVLRSDAGAALLTGDTVLGRGTTVVAHPDGRLGDYLDSLRLLRARSELVDAGMVLPGHGPALERPIEVIDYYLAHRAQRLEQVRTAAAAHGDSTDDLAQAVVELVYFDVPRAVWPAALLSVRAQLEYLDQL